MKEYNQPKHYHFSRDSIDLARFAHQLLVNKKNIDIIDLGCGCGVVGIEFTRLHNSVSTLTLLEKEEEFFPFIKENCARFLDENSYKLVNRLFSNHKLEKKFDLVISNPPYYLENTGRCSGELKKDQCHFFCEEEMNSFFEAMRALRLNDGLSLFSGRNNQPFIKKRLNLGEIKETHNMGKSSIFEII
jgi:tRNA1(Val) A37 N6-methylase TrmN6